MAFSVPSANHGDSLTITGSGFGTKEAQTPHIWDHCNHGNSVDSLYTRRWHNSNTSGYQEDYRDPSNYPIGDGIAPLHTRNGSKVLCGMHHAGIVDGDNGQDVQVSKDYERPNGADDWWSLTTYYIRVSPNFAHGDDDNFKLQYLRRGGGYGGAGTHVMYWNFQGSAWTSGTITGWGGQLYDPTGAGGMSPQNNLGGSYPVNLQQVWCKYETVIHYSTTTNGGSFYHRCNQTIIMNKTLRTHLSDAYQGRTDWQDTIGSYARARTNVSARYYADIFQDINESNPGRFYLTDHATWGSETYAEIQPYTAWAATSVTLTVNGGALSDGTVHVHYRDEVNGNQYLGTWKLGAPTVHTLRPATMR